MRSVDPPAAPDGFRRTAFAENQPEYDVLQALVGPAPERAVVSYWEPSDEELERLLDGKRVRLEVLTFGHPLQPVRLEVET